MRISDWSSDVCSSDLLYDGYVQSRFDVGDREAVLSVGYQTIRWGESTLIARNAIAEINAPNSAVLHTPGTEINEIFRPTAAALLSTSLTDNISTELFYQLKWRAVQPDPNRKSTRLNSSH